MKSLSDFSAIWRKRRRWEDNIKMNIKEMIENMVLIHVA
jgi:hypothetical protein